MLPFLYYYDLASGRDALSPARFCGRGGRLSLDRGIGRCRCFVRCYRLGCRCGCDSRIVRLCRREENDRRRNYRGVPEQCDTRIDLPYYANGTQCYPCRLRIRIVFQRRFFYVFLVNKTESAQ